MPIHAISVSLGCNMLNFSAALSYLKTLPSCASLLSLACFAVSSPENPPVFHARGPPVRQSLGFPTTLSECGGQKKLSDSKTTRRADLHGITSDAAARDLILIFWTRLLPNKNGVMRCDVSDYEGCPLCDWLIFQPIGRWRYPSLNQWNITNCERAVWLTEHCPMKLKNICWEALLGPALDSINESLTKCLI